MSHKRFGDFADEPPLLDGDKVKIDQLLNREILVIGYRITESKYENAKNSKKCLTIQFEVDGERHIAFTGSSVLHDQIVKYKDELPFLATIKKVDKYFTFS